MGCRAKSKINLRAGVLPPARWLRFWLMPLDTRFRGYDGVMRGSGFDLDAQAVVGRDDGLGEPGGERRVVHVDVEIGEDGAFGL